MAERAELPLIEPLYKTYNYQGSATVLLAGNPSIQNRYFNQVMNLTCSRRFLKGLTTPIVDIPDSSWQSCPYLERIALPVQFTKGYINLIIREMIDSGYYVEFTDVDDYYVKGKSWYRERHQGHDGLICGYDRSDQTYTVVAYDEKWVYRKFQTPQRAFNAGRIAMEKRGIGVGIYALKPKADIVEFSPRTVYEKLREYLDSDLRKYPFSGEGPVFGIAVHDYIAEYAAMLFRGEIPYARMDRRVLRLIWEHKCVMQKRIVHVEKSLGLDDSISRAYAALVRRADTMRMLYASHHMRRRDSVLPVIRQGLLQLAEEERALLTQLTLKMEGRHIGEAVAFS